MTSDNLKPLVRVLLSFVITNVAPRIGDKQAIKSWELLVLYAIMTDEYAYSKPHTMFSIADMCKNEQISCVKTKLWHKNKYGDNARVKVLHWGKQAPQHDEMDDQDCCDEELMRRKREAGIDKGEGSSRQVEEPRQSTYSWGIFDDDTQARVESMHPPEYATWETFQKSIYDHGLRKDAERESQHKELMAHNRAMHMSYEINLNMQAFNENQLRRHNDYYLGVLIVT
ncbi:hypothetical protein Hanom_Chr06g00534491 [Helianthus anomalus]